MQFILLLLLPLAAHAFHLHCPSPAISFRPFTSFRLPTSLHDKPPETENLSNPNLSNPNLCGRFLSISVPAFIQLTAEPLASLVDTAFIGRLGPSALGGAGVAISAQYALSKLYNDPLLKTSISLVATADADPTSTAESLSTAISTALILAAVIGVAQFLFYFTLAPKILKSMAVPASSSMFPSAFSYLRLRSLGSPAATLWLVSNGIFRGLGDTKTPLVYALLFTSLNVLLDPLFVFTLNFGAGGAALATSLSQTVALVPLLYTLHKRIGLKKPENLAKSIEAYLVAGGAVLIRTIAKVGLYAYTASAAAILGPVAAAAYNLTFQLGFATTQICESVAVAVQTLLARDFAKEGKEGKRLINFSILAGGGIAVALSTGTFVFKKSILSALTSEPSIQAAALSIFPIVLVAQVLKGLAYPTNGIVMGAMDWQFSTVTMWVSNIAAMGYLRRVGAGGLGLAEIWKGLTIFMAVQVGVSLARIASKTGPFRILRESKETA